jgi:adenylate cyclase
MKLSIWFAAIPVIFMFSLLELTFDLGEQGTLNSHFLREHVYPITRSMHGTMTNFKFKIRGIEAPKQKVIIIAADDKSVEKLGRWPWHREVYAQLIHSLFKAGAKVVGLDMVFSESEERIPPEVYTMVEKSKPALVPQLKDFEGDPILAEVIQHYQNRLVLGYTPNLFCQPRYNKSDCPIHNEEFIQTVNAAQGKFAEPEKIPLAPAVIEQSPLLNLLTGVFNIPIFRDAARYAGFFFVQPDPDGYIRRYPLFFAHQDHYYFPLALKIAEIVRGDTAQVDFTEDARIQKMYFSQTPDQPIPVTPLGNIDLNFRGPRETYPTLSAFDVVYADVHQDHTFDEKLKDAIVVFGVTALGDYDMRAFPFDSVMPGVEGQATAVDNLLSNDALRSASSIHLAWLPLALLIIFGFLFSYFFSQYEAVPSLALFAGFTLLAGYVDIHFLFENQINFPSIFLLLEVMALFLSILSIRYILEERNRKYVRTAFSHYLAPQVVDLVLKDPSHLTTGGERKELTILFSDVRGFTTISEGMEPKKLSQFLNEYLSEMTDIVFEYGGTLDKYIGDAVMAFWGAPLDQPDHALRACEAAIAMQRKVAEIAPKLKEKYGAEISIGVGINSGIVSVGNMGSKKIFEYTVIGDHVNLASRLEGLTRLYGTQILSTRNTLAALPEEMRKKINYRVLDIVKVKGKSQASDLIEILLDPIAEEALELFYLAKTEFKNKNWDVARELFEKSNRVYQNQRNQPDEVCLLFASRCETFKNNPPPPDWDGTAEMRTK